MPLAPGGMLILAHCGLESFEFFSFVVSCCLDLRRVGVNRWPAFVDGCLWSEGRRGAFDVRRVVVI